MNEKWKEDWKEKMIAKWPSAIVARTHIEQFSGGLLTQNHMRNLDSKGKGPNKLTFGRKVAYPVQDLINWMEERKEQL